MLLQIIFLNFKAKAAKGFPLRYTTTVIARNMKIKSTIFLLFSTLFLWGCMEEIVMDPGERTVVVECVIDNEDKVQTVNLSYSATVSDKTYPKVEEAVVRMSFALDTFYTDFEDGHTVIVDTSGCHEFVKVADGVWQAEFEPIEYARYTLEVEVSGYDRITATTVFPPKMSVGIGFALSYSVYTYDNRNIWIYGLDYNPITSKYEVADYIYGSDRYMDNFNLTEVTKDDIEEFRWPENGLYWKDLVYKEPVEGFHVTTFFSPGYYLFLWGLDWTYNWNVGMGLDVGYGDDLMAVHDVPWPNDYGYNFHDRYIRWEYRGGAYPGTLLKKHFGLRDPANIKIEEVYVGSIWIAVNFKPYRYYAPHPLSRLVFDSVSEELDRYYKDVITFEQMQQQPFTDLTELWDRFEVYSNIEGGEGIFGAAYRVKALWGIYESYYNYYLESLKEQ